MSAITSNLHFRLEAGRRRTRVTRRPWRLTRMWREIGVGLAVALLGLVLSAFALQASLPVSRSDSATYPTLTAQQEGIHPALFPPNALPVP